MSVAIWTLKLGAVTKSLEAWGIEQASVAAIFNSLSADEFSFVARQADILADPVFNYGDAITLYKAGTAWFIGTIRQVPVAGSAQSDQNRYMANNVWWDLERIIYQQAHYVYNDTFTAFQGKDSTQVVLGQSPTTGAKIKTDVQIANLITYAIAAGASFTGSTSFTGVTPPYEEARDISVAAAIQRMCSWTPDIVSRCVYSSGAPVLTFLRRADASSLDVDLTAGAPLRSWSISARNDLVPNGVMFKFLSGSINAADGDRYTRVTEQVAGVMLIGGVKQVNTLDFTGLTPAGLANKYLFYWFPTGWYYLWFNLDGGGVDPAAAGFALPVAISTGYTSAQIATAVASAMTASTYYAASAVGSVVTATDANFGVRGDPTAQTSGVAVAVTTPGVDQTLPANIVGMIIGSLTLSGLDNNQEVAPPNLASDYYSAVSTVFYEGECRFKALDVPGTWRPGNRLNFLNGRTAWATAAALVQRVTENISTGETVVSFGPPPALAINDLLSLAARLKKVLMGGSRTGLQTVIQNDVVLGNPATAGRVSPNPTTAPNAGILTPNPSAIVTPGAVAAAIKKSATLSGSPVKGAISSGAHPLYNATILDLCDGSEITVLAP